MSNDPIPDLTRMELHNWSSGESKTCHSNPAEIEETASVIWRKKHPVGHSSARLQYRGTDNRGVGFTLYFDADKLEDSGWTQVIRESTGQAVLTRPEEIMDWRRYLLSFMYPVQRDDGQIDEPPDAVWIWPGFITLRTKVADVRFGYTRWMQGKINIFTARIRLLSVSDILMTSQDVRAEGTGALEFILG